MMKLTFARFQPAEAEKITGLKPALVRDWRRRKLIHPSLDRDETGFDAGNLATLLFIARLSEHGIGPSRVYAWAAASGSAIMRHALGDRDAWATNEDWTAHNGEDAGDPARYAAVLPQPFGVHLSNSLDGLFSNGVEVATVVDLHALGSRLCQKAGRPLAWYAEPSA